MFLGGRLSMFKFQTKLGSLIGSIGGDILGEVFVLRDKLINNKK